MVFVIVGVGFVVVFVYVVGLFGCGGVMLFKFVFVGVVIFVVFVLFISVVMLLWVDLL